MIEGPGLPTQGPSNGSLNPDKLIGQVHVLPCRKYLPAVFALLHPRGARLGLDEVLGFRGGSLPLLPAAVSASAHVS